MAQISVPLLERGIGEGCADGERYCFEVHRRAHFIAAEDPENIGSPDSEEVGFTRKDAEADFSRRIFASKHRCESSRSLRVSSILTMPIVVLQTGHTDSYVPLSLCVRMNLRGCGAAKDGLFVARERPQR